jgi:hypothetical protein
MSTNPNPLGGLVGAGGSNTSSSVSVNPDGSLNLGGITGQSAIPTDSSGSVDIWNMPSFLKGHVFWWDSGETKQSGGQSRTANNGQDLVPGQTVPIDKPHSFDINASAESIMKQFTAMAYNKPAEFQALQAALAQGPWASNLKLSGVNDAQTEGALAKAMTQYLKLTEGAGVAISFKQYILDAAQGGPGGLGQTNTPGGSGGGMSSVSLTDPAELMAQAQSAASASLGHVLTHDELSRFVDNFHAAQTAAQHKAGSIYDGMSAGAEANQFAQQSDPQGFANHQAQGYMDSFVNMFLSGNEARGNVAPVTPITGA